jgi:hypothetical protein
MIDFQMINVHTGRYVSKLREESNRNNPAGLPTQFNRRDGARDGFSYY